MRSRLRVILILGGLLAGCGGDDTATTTTAAPTTTQATTTAAPVTTTAALTTTSTALEGPGLTWTRADREGVLAGPGLQMVLSMVVGGPGLVAVGSEESEGDADAAVWLSVDGHTWTQAPHDADTLGGLGIQMMYSVAVGGPGLVAVGVDDPDGSPEEGLVDADAAVWVSADGYTWTRIPHDEAVFGGPEGQRMMDVTAGGPGLVAIGSDYQDGSTWPDGAVWVSADGFTWTRVDDPAVFGGHGGQEILSVTAGGPGVVAVGSGESYSNAAVWVSEDGYSWSRIPNNAAVFGGASEMSRVMVAGPGLVAVGGSTGGSDHVMVWVSVDGYAWTRIEDGADLNGSGSLSVHAAALWRGGLALVGKDESSDQTAVVFWLSADGYRWDRISPDQAVFGNADDLEIAALAGWGTGLVLLVGDVSSDDWNGAVWVTPPPG